MPPRANVERTKVGSRVEPTLVRSTFSLLPTVLHRAIRGPRDGCFINLLPCFFPPLEKIDRIIGGPMNDDEFPSLRAQLIEIAFKREEFAGE